jgi:threonine dehydrogenase-like Zn-dependent dehydrogenase
MRAVVITPGQQDSDRLVEVPDPTPTPGEALVRVLSVGVDGTDDELVAGQYGQAPDGEDQLIIGHESLGRVAQPAGDLAEGQLVAAIVRRPDPVPCPNCANDEWDYCLNGQYTERGIKGHVEFLCPLRRGPRGMTYPVKRMLSSAPGAVRSPLPGADGASC